MPYRDFDRPHDGLLSSIFDGPSDPRWRRLLMRDALSTRDPNALVVGGINTPGGADNGITETAATSQITVASGAGDLSRPSTAAGWLFDIRNQTNQTVTTARPLVPEFVIEVVSMQSAMEGICIECGYTNSLTFVGQHTEGGMHEDATGRRLRVGSHLAVVDLAAAAGLVYSHSVFTFAPSIMSHSVSHALDASKAIIAANRKVGQNTNVTIAGQLYAYFSIGRSAHDGNAWSVGVRVYHRHPIMQMATY